MVFSSISFLFYFLPILFLCYYLAPQRLKNLVMIIGSLVFFAWGEIRFIPVMLLLSVEDYICGRLMEKNRENEKKRRLFMLISVGSNLSVLVFFKYTSFLLQNFSVLTGIAFAIPKIILPIGVSFNSFQSISYAIDVYRGTTSCEKSYYNYLAYTTLFPQIIAGPIVRYVTVENDLDDHQMTRDSLSLGMRRFLLGLGKKVLIANNVGFLANQIADGRAGVPSVLLYWLGITAYTFQIYFDFSGYSDMAIGLARVFGLTFDENFNFPYISQSITEFWRRWHITLGAWFRDYVYIPMGGNRVSVRRHLFNLLAVWALTGFWHGASWNFVLWGLYYGFLLMIEKYLLMPTLKKIPAFFRHVYTLLLVMFGWVIFYFEDLHRMSEVFQGMLGLAKIPLYNEQSLYYLWNYGIIFLLAAYFSTPHFKKYLNFADHTVKPLPAAATAAFYGLLFCACIAYLVNSTYNPFLYFRF
ncbi:MAG: MBOAT family protein [Negativicutes bacterium]|nr:MBOAT family protein [Negativicutes bacterium]